MQLWIHGVFKIRMWESEKHPLCRNENPNCVDFCLQVWIQERLWFSMSPSSPSSFSFSLSDTHPLSDYKWKQRLHAESKQLLQPLFFKKSGSDLTLNFSSWLWPIVWCVGVWRDPFTFNQCYEHRARASVCKEYLQNVVLWWPENNLRLENTEKLLSSLPEVF